MKGITVYCASSTNISQQYYDAARQVGAEIARHGLPVINGGGKMGLMRAVSDGALDAGGQAIGVIPQFMVDAGRNYDRLTQTIVTDSMHTRKKQMSDLAMGVIALPGGIGTLEELSEMLTWRKLGLFGGPVVILNTDGFYDHLIAWLRHAAEQGFIYHDDKDWHVVTTPAEAVEIIVNSNLAK